MNWLRKNMRTIFLVTIVGFIGGTFIGFGRYLFSGGGFMDAIAEVNGKKIPYRKYLTLLNRVMDNLRSSNTEITDEIIKRTRQDVLQDLIQEEVLYQEALKYGIVVTDGELIADIQQFPAFREDNGKGRFNQQIYFQVLAWQLRVTPQEFEESRRRQIAIAKLRNLISSSIKITQPELHLEYARRNQNNLTNFEKEKEEFYKQLHQEKTTAFLNDWFNSINSTLKVKLFTQRFEL